jgi:decaprenylphospho-beta-D-erythro-pentofuranosid-2-ulose 2-reductase
VSAADDGADAGVSSTGAGKSPASIGVSASAGSRGRRVIVLGGTSEIALAIVCELQRRGSREVVLVGRNPDALSGAAEGLRAAGCLRVGTLTLEALDTERHGEVLAQAFGELGGADIVILAVGTLGERGGLPADVPDAVQTIQINLVGAGSLLIHAARRLREQGGGTIVVLSSATAERPRRANAVYGASKAGLDALAQALGDDLRERGVRMLVVRPGFVHTRMTRGLDPAPLATTPQALAGVVVAGLDRDAHTVWAPRPMRGLMLAMRMLPRPLFRRIQR